MRACAAAPAPGRAAHPCAPSLAGVFTKLEELGAFSLAEKALPLVEELGVLSFLQTTLDVDSALLFTIANWLIVAGPIYFVLMICGFVDKAQGGVLAAELLAAATVSAGGAALFAWAFILSQLQDEDAPPLA